MKTLKTIILGLIAVMAFGAASAKTTNPAKEKISVNYAVTTYVNAVAHGKTAGLSDVIDDNNFKYTMLRGENAMDYSKDDLLTSLKTSENVEQDCTTSVSVSENTPGVNVAKVVMKYKGFTRTNYVTLTDTSDGWKITNIYSVFK
jgi:hypothetical protein